jgi:hypothetical protein
MWPNNKYSHYELCYKISNRAHDQTGISGRCWQKFATLIRWSSSPSLYLIRDACLCDWRNRLIVAQQDTNWKAKGKENIVQFLVLLVLCWVCVSLLCNNVCLVSSLLQTGLLTNFVIFPIQLFFRFWCAHNQFFVVLHWKKYFNHWNSRGRL